MGREGQATKPRTVTVKLVMYAEDLTALESAAETLELEIDELARQLLHAGVRALRRAANHPHDPPGELDARIAEYVRALEGLEAAGQDPIPPGTFRAGLAVASRL